MFLHWQKENDMMDVFVCRSPLQVGKRSCWRQYSWKNAWEVPQQALWDWGYPTYCNVSNFWFRKIVNVLLPFHHQATYIRSLLIDFENFCRIASLNIYIFFISTSPVLVGRGIPPVLHRPMKMWSSLPSQQQELWSDVSTLAAGALVQTFLSAKKLDNIYLYFWMRWEETAGAGG